MSDTTIDGHPFGIDDIPAPASTIDIERSTISNLSDYGILSLGQSSIQISNSTIESLKEGVASQDGSTADSSTILELPAPKAVHWRFQLGSFSGGGLSLSDAPAFSVMGKRHTLFGIGISVLV